MGFLKAGDIISGQEGRAHATINGLNYEMFYLRNLRATAEKQKSDIKTLGKRGTQRKAAGWSGTGSMTIYYVTSMFRKMMYDYIKTGKDVYFDITIVNEDPNSTIGRQTVTLLGVNLDSVVMAALDVDADELDEDIDFTWEDIDMPDLFADPTLG
ncbi:phage tail tube protein [Paenibacillus naphthalenovorans]|uniref:phage tail tube protein n=1 Tax=Paenibacillus naphthalenovorans TaxID=162209 RepID=UPI000885577F|nr:phage tail tube protein [Paenibacillus naphthalenovorans]SDJ76390.1 Phage tail tube protein [Paenibacillus naphthalenovorans]